ncbi:MAG: hypothetical protein AAF418_06725 [Pseudomonadota bacterium]
MLQDIIDTIGEDAAKQLIIKFGNQAIYVPKSPTRAWGRIIALIGPEKAEALRFRFEGDQITLAGLRTAQADHIRQLIRFGLSNNAIANRLGCSRATVRRHRHQMKGNAQS